MPLHMNLTNMQEANSNRQRPAVTHCINPVRHSVDKSVQRYNVASGNRRSCILFF